MNNKVPTLKAHFRHNNGFICCGSLRIAREDFDTNPSTSFTKELFDWICCTLNDEIDRINNSEGRHDASSETLYDPSSPNGYD